MLIQLPIKLPSCANMREHWAARAKRTKHFRLAAGYAVAGEQVPDGPVVVTLTRIGKRTLDDDNLASAFKAIRDGVADGLGINDNDPSVTWAYAQRVGKVYGIEIEIGERK